ncbi:acyltransferase [Bacteroides zoogleoformans]|uniref:acyltransferase n=1 Tax=Bacteroides zoogleoformans TaxID=28119 RepID=UPI00248D620F|nr:acyltransferase [Bacteroides zoogleoformans]
MSRITELKKRIKQSPVWEKRIHRLMFSNARPRLWVKWMVNPLVFRHGKGAVIRHNTIINVSPLNQFRLGANSTIEEYCVIDNGVGDVIIGDHTRIGLRSTLIGPVQVGRHVILAQNTVLSGLNHNYENPDLPIHQQGVSTRSIRIGDGSWIGANAIITAGVNIGENVIVGAGSVVTGNIPPHCVVVGNPARIIKKLDAASGQWVKVE